MEVFLLIVVGLVVFWVHRRFRRERAATEERMATLTQRIQHLWAGSLTFLMPPNHPDHKT